MHDLERVARLTHHFGVKTAVCINKADINPELADEMEKQAAGIDLPVLGRIRYDPAVTWAQVHKKTVVEGGAGPAESDIRALWTRTREVL